MRKIQLKCCIFLPNVCAKQSTTFCGQNALTLHCYQTINIRLCNNRQHMAWTPQGCHFKLLNVPHTKNQPTFSQTNQYDVILLFHASHTHTHKQSSNSKVIYLLKLENQYDDPLYSPAVVSSFVLNTTQFTDGCQESDMRTGQTEAVRYCT